MKNTLYYVAGNTFYANVNSVGVVVDIEIVPVLLQLYGFCEVPVHFSQA